MKTLVLLILIMVSCIEMVSASPAGPIWTMSTGGDGLNNNYFGSDPNYANRLFQNGEINYLTAGVSVSNGTRFRIGYGFGGKDLLGDENKKIIAGVDKKLNENWWVAVDYLSGKSIFGGINVIAAYSITPNMALSVGYSYLNNYEAKNAIRTQLNIKF